MSGLLMPKRTDFAMRILTVTLGAQLIVSATGTAACAASFKTIFSFSTQGGPANPNTGLTNVGGVLYGTTAASNGAIFSLTKDDVEKTLYAFTGGNDGCSPNANVTYLDGVLYTTSALCGINNNGAIVGITLQGQATVLHTYWR
jgi:hypothetical protein